MLVVSLVAGRVKRPQLIAMKPVSAFSLMSAPHSEVPTDYPSSHDSNVRTYVRLSPDALTLREA